ncbi:MAG: hypothetical protein OSJ54_11125, partial [Oscillospiraceae bacterium]|nr:hypothetical protein [Oscillospiraceae bacterium]
AAAIHPLAELLNERGFRRLRVSILIMELRQWGAAPLTPASCAQLAQLSSGGLITLVRKTKFIAVHKKSVEDKKLTEHLHLKLHIRVQLFAFLGLTIEGHF